MKYPAKAEQIIQLKNEDLALRQQLIEQGILSDGYNDEMAALHVRNAVQLNTIIEEIGYPTEEKVGPAGSQAAWLIIQHAIGQPSFMKKCALLLAAAVDSGHANSLHLAYLQDRIAVLQGEVQLYGTQFDWDEKGLMSPEPYDNLDQVNERRASIGLNSLEEQTAIMRERVVEEKESPPSDYDKRKKEKDEWRQSVGWIK